MRRGDLWPCPHIYGYNTVEVSEGTTFSPIKRAIIMPSTTRTTGMSVPACPADYLRGYLDDRRGAQVAAGIPVRLHGQHQGRGHGSARLAPVVVPSLDQHAAPGADVLGRRSGGA